MIPIIESASSEREKQRFAARSNGGNEITLPCTENGKENVFLHTFCDVYKKSQEQKGKTK